MNHLKYMHASRAGRCARRQRGFLSSRQSLVLLGLLFLSPMLIAWIMHLSGQQGWRPEGTTNQGVLVQPPRPLVLPADIPSAAGGVLQEGFLQGKWTLLYIGATDCGEACRTNLYHMRQVRLAQGENIQRVQRLFLAADTMTPETLGDILNEYPEMATGALSPEQSAELAPLFMIDAVQMRGAERVYLVDPLGNVMMYYRAGADPRGMINDLHRLLKYSRIG
ncbi:MAG: SCO family protein [Gammaproteobacteria bacterium]|nr:SCO family protein [Gammaproteobacteria bacterium]MDH3559548.1 SCO family protein [Gammaproteobacteria bacterium]